MTFRSDSEIVALARRAVPQLSPARAAIITALLPLVGLEVDRPAYLESIYRHDHPSRRLALARRQSACGFVREYALEEAGLQDERLKLGGDVRGARGGVLYPLVLEQTIAAAKGALRKPDPKRRDLPFEGDGIIIGCKAGRGIWSKGGLNEEHMLTVTSLVTQASGSAYEIDSIDGGQPGIHGRTRALVWCGPNGDELWAANLDDSGGYVFDANDMRPTKGRRVYAWTDADALLN